MQETIQNKISSTFAPQHFEVINESYKHSVPPGSESHFKVVIVSPQFEKKSLVQRHQLVNLLLADELKNGVHALSIQAYTADEWKAKGMQSQATPDCHGGSKHKEKS